MNKTISLTAVLLTIILLSAACDSEPAAPTTTLPSPPPVAAIAQPSPTATPIPDPTATPEPTPTPGPTATPTATPEPTPTPKPVAFKNTDTTFAGYCGVKSDGEVICWGYLKDIKIHDRFKSIAGGHHVLCGLYEDGVVGCVNASPDDGAPPQSLRFKSITGSFPGGHICALREDDGSAFCWGYNEHGQASPPSGSFAVIDAGGFHTCALREDGTAVCWGDNRKGQASPPRNERFTQISAGSYSHTCALREDGTAVCWGDNEYGQSRPPRNERFTQISAGGFHTCALREDGTAMCWGDNLSGQGNVSGALAWISTGQYKTCGLRFNGRAVCWPPYDSLPGVTFRIPDASVATSGGAAVDEEQPQTGAAASDGGPSREDVADAALACAKAAAVLSDTLSILANTQATYDLVQDCAAKSERAGAMDAAEKVMGALDDWVEQSGGDDASEALKDVVDSLILDALGR